MAALRYEIVDREHPTWRGQRFSALDRARREWAQSVPRSRFYVRDRETGADVTEAAAQ